MAIGLYDKTLSQPTAVPNWYKAPTELIAKAIAKKQMHYDLNRKGLDDLGVELDKADGIEGIEKTIVEFEFTNDYIEVNSVENEYSEFVIYF